MRLLDAFRRRSLRRTGPTGTPLIPTYHSSVLELEESTAIAAETEDGSSCGAETAFENAPARPAPAAGAGGFAGALPPGGRDEEGAGVGAGVVRGFTPDKLGLIGRGGGGAFRGGGKPDAAACTAPFDAETPVEADGLGRSTAGLVALTEVSVTDASTSIIWLHLRHFIRTVRPATLSSAI